MQFTLVIPPQCIGMPVPTVRPIPLYHRKEWMDDGCTKVSPLLCPVPILSIPSHCTMGGDEWAGIVPVVHFIPTTNIHSVRTL